MGKTKATILRCFCLITIFNRNCFLSFIFEHFFRFVYRPLLFCIQFHKRRHFSYRIKVFRSFCHGLKCKFNGQNKQTIQNLEISRTKKIICVQWVDENEWELCFDCCQLEICVRLKCKTCNWVRQAKIRSTLELFHSFIVIKTEKHRRWSAQNWFQTATENLNGRYCRLSSTATDNDFKSHQFDRRDQNASQYMHTHTHAQA